MNASCRQKFVEEDKLNCCHLQPISVNCMQPQAGIMQLKMEMQMENERKQIRERRERERGVAHADLLN